MSLPSTGSLRFDNGLSDIGDLGGGGEPRFGGGKWYMSICLGAVIILCITGPVVEFTCLLFLAGIASRPPPTVSAPAKGVGMKLGKSQKANQFLESLKAEGEVIVEDVHSHAGPLQAAVLPSDPITISIEERLSVTLKKDGGLENLEVQGTMALVVQRQEDAYLQVQVRPFAVVMRFC